METSAKLYNLRRSPRKVRLVANLIRGMDVDQAEYQLNYTVKGSAPDILKLLKSAVANAENNYGMDKGNLFIKEIFVNEGPVLKRYLPRAFGRASLIKKRTSHIEIIVAEKIEGKGRKKVRRIETKEPEVLSAAEMTKPAKEKRKERKEPSDVKEEKEFLEEKKKSAQQKGFFKRIFRRKSM